ncbi:MAG: SoxR reducing system RseC family protein [gamma proteobacterium symbiont of Bathyaustriella thionipta]|nr:SoxR reducing system RseC family protein [gamma proteobacterium symbiont of Bathyaustriella thionipta]MCU7949873.1 SoxR reducing system RseC family protein [gamma proteobacterium symbiont of Bathyaustriella thionipta]MCU7952115.1 SoxR reducing system RseC family protein [gamma proteobacterium symbiont of Bathyaustriella thionipta]MCU7956465.1 SoxR reducing system RseC family protein [gamma proteobacterium symbiont of Bathyaustriella thionipta]MCU7965792.1 SoxR reducing system RseC family pro
MIEEQATVINNEGKYVWVNTQRQSSCGHCSVKNGCGTHVLSKVLGNKMAYVRCLNIIDEMSLNNYSDLKEGDRVVIGLEESALLGGSFLMYLLPLIIMIVFGGIAVYAAKLWWPEGTDLFAVIASVSGLLLGLSFSHQFAQKNTIKNQFEPRIIKKLPEKEWLLKSVLPS